MAIKITEKSNICLKKAHYENVTIYLLSMKCVTTYLEVFIAIIRFQRKKKGKISFFDYGTIGKEIFTARNS